MKIEDVDINPTKGMEKLVSNLVQWPGITLAALLLRFNNTFDVNGKVYFRNDDVDERCRTQFHSGPDGLDFCIAW